MVSRPLDGIRILDLTRFVAGSYATFVLSALGAEVLKLEVPPHGDPYRFQGTAWVGEDSVLFSTLNSGKKSIGIDIRSPEAGPVLDRLLGSVDAVVENARPGSLANYGLDYASIRDRHPHIVYGSISGFGDVGPEANRGGFDLILQALSGLMAVTGHPDTGPTKVGAPVIDVGAGLSCALGVLAMLVARCDSGEGGSVSTSLLEFSLASLATVATAELVSRERHGLLGTHSPTFAPYGAFRSGDGYVVLAGAGSEDLWQRFCQALGRRDLIDDPRFVTNEARVANRDALTVEIESTLASHDAAYWLTEMDRSGIPAGRVNELQEAFEGPQIEALGMIQHLNHSGGVYPVVSAPVRVDRKTLPVTLPSPRFGEHTREILRKIGFTDEDIDALVVGGTAAENK